MTSVSIRLAKKIMRTRMIQNEDKKTADRYIHQKMVLIKQEHGSDNRLSLSV